MFRMFQICLFLSLTLAVQIPAQDHRVNDQSASIPGPVMEVGRVSDQIPVPLQKITAGEDWPVELANSLIAMHADATQWDWDWGEGVMMFGMMKTFQATGDAQYFDYIKSYVDRYVPENGQITAHIDNFAYVNGVAPAALLPFLYQTTLNAKYLIAAQIVSDYVFNTVDRVSNGAIAHVFEDELWIDTLFMTCSFLIQMARLTGETRYFDEAVNQILWHADKMFSDPDSLFYHGWDENGSAAWAHATTYQSPEFWARGNGWAAVTLVELLESLPITHPGRDAVLSLFKKQISRIVGLQDAGSDLWFTVIDRGGASGNYLETSASSMFVYAMQKGIANQWLDPAFQGKTSNGNTALDGNIRFSGWDMLYHIDNISIGTMVGDYDYYVARPLLNDVTWGFGAMLMAKTFFRPNPDRIHPQILNPAMTQITSTSATVEWNTDEACLGEVELVGNPSYRIFYETPRGISRTQHGVIMDQLLPGHTYELILKSWDTTGNQANVHRLFFTTKIVKTSQAVSLNGIWDFTPKGLPKTTHTVPGFYVTNRFPKPSMNFPLEITGPWKIIPDRPESTYERTLVIPDSMIGKHIFLKFDAVNYLADIFINDRFITRHIGGYIPFEIDITSFVDVPSTNALRVEIGYNDPDFLDNSGYAIWPTGFFGNFWELGIAGDVSLIGRNSTFVDNMHIQPSLSQQKLDVVLTLINADTAAHDVQISCSVLNQGNQTLFWPEQSVTLTAGDTISMPLSQAWSDPILWTPDNPHLYHMVTRISKNNILMHEKTERFGVREFKIQGTHFTLNGIRTNLRGDNIVSYGEKQYWKYWTPTPETWSVILDSMKALNFNVIRLNESPPPKWMIDLCDEKGMMVLAESAIMCRVETVPFRSQVYAENAVIWQREWIRQTRNHPSIVIWVAENEMYYHGYKRCTLEQNISFGQAILDMDSTRPITYEGDLDLDGNADIYSIHYIYKYPAGWPTGSIYDMMNYVHDTIPTAFGEFAWWDPNMDTPHTHIRKQCVKARTARIVDFADIRPFRLDWAWHPNPAFNDIYYPSWIPSAAEKEFLRDTFNPVAALDKRFYEMRFTEWTPLLGENDVFSRTLVVFNDEDRDTDVLLKWFIHVNGAVVDSGEQALSIPLGDHVEQPILLRAPFVASDRVIQIEFCTYKQGRLRFSETYSYLVRDKGLAPPAKIDNVVFSKQNGNTLIEWPPVTKNVEGGAETVRRYEVTRSPDCFQTPANIETFVTTQPRFLDTQNAGPGRHAFYQLVAVDDTDLSSKPTGILTMIQYDLRTSPTTDFNHISLPFNPGMPRDARELLQRLPGCESVAIWSHANQGYEQYIPQLVNSNFTLGPGSNPLVEVISDTSLTWGGILATPNYVLPAFQNQANYHNVMLPFTKSNLLTASDLLNDIPGCNALAQWNADTQGFDQYDPGLPQTDFDVLPGFPYLIHATQNTTWPEPQATPKANARQVSSSFEGRIRAPHMVWGRIEKNFLPIRFKAWLQDHPTTTLSQDSPGCLLTKDFWTVQCAAFPKGWKAGDPCFIEFTNSAGETIRRSVTLTWQPSDELALSSLPEHQLNLPSSFSVANYPNPFNAGTTISIGLDRAQKVTIKIYNLNGQIVANFSTKNLQPGYQTINWNAADKSGGRLPSGVYILQVTADREKLTHKMILTN